MKYDIEKYNKGQYFTTNKNLQKYVYTLIKNKPKIILEPSVGQGDLVDYVLKFDKTIKFHLYEIDKQIKLLKSITDKVIYGDFLKQKINTTYDTIIGNPPYVKIKKGKNLYIGFIEKCYELLNENGELIFIVPSDFIKLTSSSNIINIMYNNGTFTDIIHPNDETLFENANIDVIIFRYCKNKKLEKKVLINNELKYLINTDGILTYSNKKEDIILDKFEEYFDIYVGIVNGKEAVYKNQEFGNVKVLNDKDKEEKYILINKFPTDNLKLNEYMLNNKETLISRKIKKFNENNWFEWGALRNYKTIQTNLGKECIYVYNLSRNKNIAFIDKVKLFGGKLIIMIPKKKINLKKIITYMNSDEFKNNYMYSGRFKIGHKQLSEALFSSEI